MKSSVSLVTLCAGAILLAAGCGKSDPAASPQPPQQASSGQAAPAAVPVPPLPDPVVPKGTEAPSPKAGQAGDHSSPAFKDGGKPDPNK